MGGALMPRVLSQEEVAQLGLEQPQEPGGARILSPEEAEALGLNNEARLQAQFGTPGQQVVTGLEGAGQALSFGLSTHLEKALGVKPEDIAAREAANPEAHTTGEVIGIAAPAIATLGASVPESVGATAARGAAELTAPALISRAGAAAAKGLGKLLPAAETAAGRVATKAATAGAQGLTEGALFGAGNVVHESALGDPNLTAEAAIEQVGMSSLLGGGIGIAGGALGGLLKEGMRGRLGQKLAEWLPELEGERNLKASGAIQSDIKAATKRMSREDLNAIGREAGELGLVSPFSTPARTLEKAQELMDSAGGRMGEILDAADGLPGAEPRMVEHLYKRVSNEVIKPLEENPLEVGTAEQLRKFMHGYGEKFAVEGVTFNDLHGMRRQLDEKLFGLRGVADPNATALKKALHDVRSIVSDEIDKGLAGTGMGNAAWRQASREYRVAATVARFAENGINRSVGNNPLSLLSVIMGATGLASHGIPGGAGLALGSELVKRYSAGLIGAGLRAVRESGALGALAQLGKANAATAERVAELTGRLMSGARGVVAAPMAKTAVMERMGQVQRFANDPIHAIDSLAKETDAVAEHAPQVAQAMQVTAARGAAFLASKVPPIPMTGPLGPKLEPSEAQVWQFGRYQAAVDRPTSILEHAAAGTLTPLDVEAVRTVYPQLYQSMKQAAMQQLVDRSGKPVPYRGRLMLSILLGQDVDGTTSPKAIQGNQAVYQRPSAKEGAAPPPPHTLGKLDGANRLMTPSQATSRNLEAP
jgi:hypothetical protein